MKHARFFLKLELDLLLLFSYSDLMPAALSFPKCCVVSCKKCGHDVLSGTDGFPASSIAVVCSLCGERRRYLPSEVIHGRPHFVMRKRRTSGLSLVSTGKREPAPASFRMERLESNRSR
jgi:hypothetical protein